MDDVEMQGLKHTAEDSVADKIADLSDAMGGFVQSILLTASLFSTMEVLINETIKR